MVRKGVSALALIKGAKMSMIAFLCIITLGFACGPWKKDNEKKEVLITEKLQAVKSRQMFYCDEAVKRYKEKKGLIHECDSVLFASLLGVACNGVDIQPFEKEQTGQMCRDWECDCYVHGRAENGSKSGYSKDMNQGVQYNMAKKPVPDLIDRIVGYLKDNNLIMCQAVDSATFASRCVMPPKTYSRWIDIQDKTSFRANLTGSPDDSLFGKTGFEAHLAVLGVLIEGEIYGAISDISKKELKTQAKREDQNALYQAAHALYESGDMNTAADLWLDQCPAGRLPNNHQDYCTSYRYQRDRIKDGNINPDWLPCPGETYHEHPGVDCAFAAHLILGG